VLYTVPTKPLQGRLGHDWAHSVLASVLGLAGRLRRLACPHRKAAERVAEELEVRRDRYGFSYLVVADGDMEAFAPVVERLAGR